MDDLLQPQFNAGMMFDKARTRLRGGGGARVAGSGGGGDSTNFFGYDPAQAIQGEKNRFEWGWNRANAQKDIEDVHKNMLADEMQKQAMLENWMRAQGVRGAQGAEEMYGPQAGGQPHPAFAQMYPGLPAPKFGQGPVYEAARGAGMDRERMDLDRANAMTQGSAGGMGIPGQEENPVQQAWWNLVKPRVGGQAGPQEQQYQPKIGNTPASVSTGPRGNLPPMGVVPGAFDPEQWVNQMNMQEEGPHKAGGPVAAFLHEFLPGAAGGGAAMLPMALGMSNPWTAVPTAIGASLLASGATRAAGGSGEYQQATREANPGAAGAGTVGGLAAMGVGNIANAGRGLWSRLAGRFGGKGTVPASVKATATPGQVGVNPTKPSMSNVPVKPKPSPNSPLKPTKPGEMVPGYKQRLPKGVKWKGFPTEQPAQ